MPNAKALWTTILDLFEFLKYVILVSLFTGFLLTPLNYMVIEMGYRRTGPSMFAFLMIVCLMSCATLAGLLYKCKSLYED